MTQAKEETRIKITAARPEGWTITEVGIRFTAVALAILVTIVASMLFTISALRLQIYFFTPKFITLSTETTECVERCEGSSCSKNTICYDSNGEPFYCAKGGEKCRQCECLEP